jgi:hypothetical protein
VFVAKTQKGIINTVKRRKTREIPSIPMPKDKPYSGIKWMVCSY